MKYTDYNRQGMEEKGDERYKRGIGLRGGRIMILGGSLSFWENVFL